MATSSIFSETLQSITTAKLSELSNKRSTFEARHSKTLHSLEAQSDPLPRVTTLLAGVKHCFNLNTSTGSTGSSQNEELTNDLRRLDRFLEQAKFDPSLTGRILTEWEETLLRHLDVQLRRYEYATLFGQLVTEWLSPDERKDATATTPSADLETGGGFEELPGKKRLGAREQFENSVFDPANVSEDAVKQYLNDLFSVTEEKEISGSKNPRKALASLRESAQKFSAQLATPNQFNTMIVARSIRGLLKSDLFAGEKRTVLKSFQINMIMLSEIADVLNMRMSALSSWSWGSSGGGVPVEQRRKVNGRFDLLVHEELLQAIFLQFLGVEWSVFFKGAFGRFRREAWQSNFKPISRIEKKRREYYLGPQETDEVLARVRRRTYRKGYFVYYLLGSKEQEIELKDGEEEAEFSEDDEDEEEEEEMVPKVAMKKMCGRGLGTGGAMRHRKIHVARLDDEESDDDSTDIHAPKKPMDRKQDLLHLLATEAAVNKRVQGTFTAFRSVFDELQSSLPHQAVLTVLEFFGVSKLWLDFFRAFLEAPLRFLDDDDDGEPRKRKRGVPASHTLSDVFSETVLFCADFSVNRRTEGAVLYRLAEDCWFWSHDHSKATTAWREVQTFAKTMGLVLSDAKSGSISIKREHDIDAAKRLSAGSNFDTLLPAGRIRWGMLYFDPATLRFATDQKLVDSHIAELKKQLAAQEHSIFAWIQVWNAYASTFFASNFGQPANCFGRSHVDAILQTHQRIQQELFAGSNVATHLKSQIQSRSTIPNLPDAFLFFPLELGGLGLHSPFISPLLLRESVAEKPSTILDAFEEDERAAYQERKTAFNKGNDPEGHEEVAEPGWKPAEGVEVFMPFEEYTQYREEFTPSNAENFPLRAYNELLQTPTTGEKETVEASAVVGQAFLRLRGHKHAKGINGYWSEMDAYWKHVALLYGPEMVELFGGLSVVESGLLPMGMVGLLMDQKVKWQG